MRQQEQIDHLKKELITLKTMVKDMIALQMHAYQNTFPEEFEEKTPKKTAQAV